MNWYKKAQNITQNFLNSFKPQSLKGLAAEALKNDTFEDFEKDFIMQIKHGTYWHLTDNPNFTIDPLKGPRDLSTISPTSKPEAGKLMITTDLENWTGVFSTRKYVAEIDMSQVDKKDYYQVKRGFGNEFWVNDPSKAKVIRVLPLNQALKIDRYRHNKISQSQEALHTFYDYIKKEYEKFKNENLPHI
jgi:hypothetical protein